jgi:hypothetical protein
LNSGHFNPAIVGAVLQNVFRRLVLRALRVLLRTLVEVRKLWEVEFNVYESCP